MSPLDIILIIFSLSLLSFCVALYRQSEKRKEQRNEARKDADESRKMAVTAATRVAEAAGLNGDEITGIMLEQSMSVNLVADKWQTQLPYGKWAEFQDPSYPDQPPPTIRGFWYNCPGRLIGVRMPKGSRYDFHKHKWAEILVGLLGTIMVHIKQESGEITVHKVGPEDTLIIPAGASHAVALAKEDSEFICVWGEPVKNS